MPTEIKSEFIRTKVNGKSLKNRRYVEYIQDLLYIEKMALDGVNNYGASMRSYRVKSAHPKEYTTIIQELAPKAYQRELEQEKKWGAESKHTAEWVERADRKRDAELKRLWLGNGGMI